MFDFEQQIKWGERAEEIVKEAATQNNIEIPEPLASALAKAVKSALSKPSWCVFFGRSLCRHGKSN